MWGKSTTVFALLNGLLHRKSDPILPSCVSDARLALDFSKYFNSKIADIGNESIAFLTNEDFSVDCHVIGEVSSIITCFQPIGAVDVRRYIGHLNKTCCELDPLKVSRLPLVIDSAAPYIAKVINKVF